jgi:PAS domain S-box-containing protein
MSNNKFLEVSSLSDSQKKELSARTKLHEERFQKLISEVEDYAIILLDEAGTITTWNRGAEKIKGYMPDEIIGRNYKIFYSKEDRDAGLPDDLLKTAHEKGKSSHEGWRIRKDGTRFWGNITITAIHNESGGVSGYLKVTRDLTERKKAEDKYSNYVEELKIKNEELKQSEQRYHKMVSEVADYVIILLDKNGKIIDWNKGAEKVKGYNAQEILGKSFRLFYTKEDKDANLPEKLLKEAADKGSVAHEGWRIRKDGTRFWGNVAITALHGDDGAIFGFSKVTRDLTDKKIAEDRLNNIADELRFKNAELKQSEERYHKMIAEVQDYAIILLDRNGIIQNWNMGAEFIKGYKYQEIVGTSFERFYPEADRAAGLPFKLLDEAAKNGKVIHEGWRVRKDGTRFWGNVVITALHNENNDIIGFSKVTRDLSAKKEAEDLLRSNALELERKNRSLEALNEQVNSFAYIASHDLKEPLRKIQVFASRILDTDDLLKAKEFADKIARSGVRMEKLMEDLLAYSQVSNDPTAFQKLDLNQILDEVRTELDLSISEKKATFQIDKLPCVHGVNFQIHQLFSNLISNSLKFSKEDEPPVITIRTRVAHAKDIPLGLVNDLKKYNNITYSDNGIGFETKEAKKIFEVFQRLHSRNEFTGTGIGLAIAKKVMENHHGTIIAEGKPSVGATFNLYFPLTD